MEAGSPPSPETLVWGCGSPLPPRRALSSGSEATLLSLRPSAEGDVGGGADLGGLHEGFVWSPWAHNYPLPRGARHAHACRFPLDVYMMSSLCSGMAALAPALSVTQTATAEVL